MRNKVCLLIFCLGIAVQNATAGQNEMIFPVSATTNNVNCRFWISAFVLFNPHSSSTTASFSAFDAAGNLVDSGSVSVDPFKTGVYQVQRTGITWVKAAGSDSIMSNEILQVLDGCPPPNPPGQLGIGDIRTRIDLRPAAVGRHHFVSIGFDRSTGFNTGISIVFPSLTGSTPAKGKLVHRNTDGQQVSERELVIPPNGQFVGMISDLLPDSLKVSGVINGSLEISFDAEVAVAALQFGWNQTL